MKNGMLMKMIAVIGIIVILAIPAINVSAGSFNAFTYNEGYDDNSISFGGGSGTLGCSVSCHGKTSIHAAWVYGGSGYLDTIARATAKAMDDSDSDIAHADLVDCYLVVRSFYKNDSNWLFDKEWAETLVNYAEGC